MHVHRRADHCEGDPFSTTVKKTDNINDGKRRKTIMGRIREKLAQFMTGRYGIDKLYYALLITFIALALIGNASKNFILVTLSWFFLIYAIFRLLSKNTYKRREENTRFEHLWNSVKKFLILTKDRIRDIKTKRYRRCPYCKRVIRFPRKIGRHQASCPQCKRGFDVMIRF